MQNLEFAQYFVKPYPQPILNGRDGLTTEDIAKALGSRNDIVVSHAKSCAEIAQRELCFCETKIENSGRGRPKTILVMPVREAKLIAASFKNRIGFAYLDFLIWFEEVAKEAMLAIAAAHKAVSQERDELKAKLEAKSLSKPKVSLIDVPEKLDGLWGPTEGKRKKKVRADQVSELELLTYKSAHLGKVTEGCGRAQQKTAKKIKDVVCSAAIKTQESLFPLLEGNK